MAKPSVRYGPGRGGAFRFYYNHRVQAAMQDLRNAVMDEMTRLGMHQFPRSQPLSLKVWFFLKRPKEEFINRQRVAGRLKPSALAEAGTIVAVKADIDNLAKFVLDSLKHSIYSDNAQVVELHMFKLHDSEGLCSGRMAIQCSILASLQMLIRASSWMCFNQPCTSWPSYISFRVKSFKHSNASP